MMSQLTIYYYSGTHWDREWYESFQGFRFRLVDMLNEAIDVMEARPEFRTFHLDGQTIPLEDFIEIESAKRDRLRRLVQEGRIVIGPWYVMPDEYLLSGESLIRNLLTGLNMCREWGTEPWKYGFVCDIFGHIAQLPQIFSGFDMPYALLGRGINDHSIPAHFRWTSPDGSECITFKLQDEYSYSSIFVAITEAVQKGLSSEETKILIKSVIERELQRSPIPVVLLMDSDDHARIRPDTAEYLKLIRETFPHAEVKHVNLEVMGRQLEEYRDIMPLKRGELNETGKDPGSNYLITHTLSSRYPIKKANDECQVWLEKWAEPLAALSALRGLSIQKAYIDLAYTYLLQNHPHDSICGCSIDQVHQDMQYRFDQTKEICRHVVRRILNWEAGKFRESETGTTLILSLWNPLAFSRNEVVTLDIDFAPRYVTQYQEPLGYEVINSFTILDYRGIEIPYGICRMQKGITVKDRAKEPKGSKIVDQYKVSLEVNVPAMGVAAYKIVPNTKPSRYLQRLSRREREAENEFIRLVIQDSGTIAIYDKKRGILYDQLLSYVDDGEIGDGWFHANPVEDRLVGSSGSECVIETVENGPARTVFRITHYMRIPGSMHYSMQTIKRSDEQVFLVIHSRVGLSKGARHVDIETEMVNTARDHRLRLVIPTGIPSPVYFASQPFAFVERSVGVRAETFNWKECDPPEKQMGGIAGKRRQDGTGLAFVSAFGLHECAAADDDRGTMYITLFRSFEKTRSTNGEMGGQVLGKVTFKYAVAVMDAFTSYGDLNRLQERLQVDVATAIAKAGQQDSMEPPVSYFEVIGSDICVSIVKRPENGNEGEWIVRCCNLSGKLSTARFTSAFTLTRVMEATLQEIPERTIPHESNSFEIELTPWKIQTLLLRFREPGTTSEANTMQIQPQE